MEENRYHINNYRQDSSSLTLGNLVTMSLALIMPSVYFLYSDIMQTAHGASASSFWIGAVVVGVSLFNFVRISRIWPGPASVYNAATAAMHPRVGFVAAWALFVFYILTAASTLILSAKLIAGSFGLPILIPTLVFPIIAFVLNYLGPRMASRVCGLILIAVIALTLIYILVCIFAASKGAGAGKFLTIIPYKGANAGLGNVFMGGGVVVLAFLGFESSSTLAAETIRDRNIVGKAATLVCVIAGLFIFFQIYASTLISPYRNGSETPTMFDIANTAGGKTLVGIYSAALILSGLIALTAAQSAAGRLLYAMGRVGAIPHHIFARRDANPHPNRKLPLLNLLIITLLTLIIGIFSSALVFFVGISKLMGAFVFLSINASMLFFAYFAKNDSHIVSALIVPAVGLLGCLAAWISLDPKIFLISLLVLAVGVVGAITIRTSTQPPTRQIDRREPRPRQEPREFSRRGYSQPQDGGPYSGYPQQTMQQRSSDRSEDVDRRRGYSQPQDREPYGGYPGGERSDGAQYGGYPQQAAARRNSSRPEQGRPESSSIPPHKRQNSRNSEADAQNSAPVYSRQRRHEETPERRNKRSKDILADRDFRLPPSRGRRF